MRLARARRSARARPRPQGGYAHWLSTPPRACERRVRPSDRRPRRRRGHAGRRRAASLQRGAAPCLGAEGGAVRVGDDQRPAHGRRLDGRREQRAARVTGKLLRRAQHPGGPRQRSSGHCRPKPALGAGATRSRALRLHEQGAERLVPRGQAGPEVREPQWAGIILSEPGAAQLRSRAAVFKAGHRRPVDARHDLDHIARHVALTRPDRHRVRHATSDEARTSGVGRARGRRTSSRQRGASFGGE